MALATTLGIAGGLASLGGAALGAQGASANAGRTGRASAEFLRLQLNAVTRQQQIADQLEAMANKLLSDQPLSDQELGTLNAARTLADEQIKQATSEGLEQALGAQASAGFLKSGRTADQIRKLTLEGSQARQQVALSREQQIAAMIERRRQEAAGLLGAAGGIGVPQNPVNAPLSQASVLGSALTSLGGAGLSLAGQFAGAAPRPGNLNVAQGQGPAPI